MVDVNCCLQMGQGSIYLVFALDGDSSTYGFVAECVAYSGRPEFVGRSWQEILDMDGVKGVMCAQRESRFPCPVSV